MPRAEDRWCVIDPDSRHQEQQRRSREWASTWTLGTTPAKGEIPTKSRTPRGSIIHGDVRLEDLAQRVKAGRPFAALFARALLPPKSQPITNTPAVGLHTATGTVITHERSLLLIFSQLFFKCYLFLSSRLNWNLSANVFQRFRGDRPAFVTATDVHLPIGKTNEKKSHKWRMAMCRGIDLI